MPTHAHPAATSIRRRVLVLALLAAGLSVLGCGSDQPSAAPPQSFVPDQSLVAVMPASIHGASCANVAYSLAQFVDLIAETPGIAAVYERLTEAAGVGMDRISVGSGTCKLQVAGYQFPIQYSIFRASGAGPGAMWRGLVAMSQAQGAPVPSVQAGSVGGRPVTAIVNSQGDVAYIYESGDLLFLYPSTGNATVDDLVVGAFP